MLYIFIIFLVSLHSPLFECFSTTLRKISSLVKLQGNLNELIITNSPQNQILQKFCLSHSNVTIVCSQIREESEFMAFWSVFSDGIQLDSAVLEPYFLGAKPYTYEETIEQWETSINARLEVLKDYNTDSKSFCSKSQITYLNKELNTAIAIVSKASHISRSLQKKLLARSGTTKDDKSPVTIADFVVQALVIDGLSAAFPDDLFIAEEDSKLLREDATLRQGVLSALSSASSSSAAGAGKEDRDWSPERLYAVVDKGQFDGPAPPGSRVWTLDPVDGTKSVSFRAMDVFGLLGTLASVVGNITHELLLPPTRTLVKHTPTHPLPTVCHAQGFMRDQHYCIALALLVSGRPALSVLGCPNLDIRSVMQPTSLASVSAVADIERRVQLPSNTAGVTDIHTPSTGSVFFAVSNNGAFARSLSMPIGSAYEVQVSSESQPSAAVFCESFETTYGDRDTTQSVAKKLLMKSEFLRLDGQCKYGVVGAGCAEANLRLPRFGYREKIWDHAAGSHFVTEAGGRVSDLSGNDIDFSQGRLLSGDVKGIIASNGQFHDLILNTILSVRGDETGNLKPNSL